MPNHSDSLILCATSRLAQSLRWQHDRAQVAAGLTQWPTLNTATVSQWFSALTEEALLRGIADGNLSRRVLDPFQEALLWESVIAESIPEYAENFFDVPGMAATAAEAHKLIVEWDLAPATAYAADETREFLRWRHRFLALCARHDVIDKAQSNVAVLDLIGCGALPVPGEIHFAGFDNITPQERRLSALLEQQGVIVADWRIANDMASSCEVRTLSDADSERHAMAQWAVAQLARNPAVQLGIVVPNLGDARDAIESALDEALHPALVRPSRVEAPRCYNFSLGKPLTQHSLVAVALELIELTCGSGAVEQSRMGELLRHPYWSAAIDEADARAQLDAAMREKLPATTTVGRVLLFAQWFARDDQMERSTSAVRGEGIEPSTARMGETDASAAWSSTGSDRTEAKEQSANDNAKLRLPQLLANLAAIETTRREWKKKASPSAWAARIRQLLRAAGWPGERSLSSHEFQARQAFSDELNKLAALDGILGDINARTAQRRLAQLCNAHVFQAETIGEKNIQVVGMLEAGGMHFDALWVMGMTDDVWPPAPRPNPLLPAELQRRAGSPNASAQAQLTFAESIHQRLLRCAPEITFSFARMDGATELRASPLLAPWLQAVAGRLLVDSDCHEAVEGRAGDGEIELVSSGENSGSTAAWAAPVDDSVAPAVKEGEHVSGGTGLLKAQAICPAWAYFRYRLGAKKLPTPVEGLDAAARGSIVHEALRDFWTTIGPTRSSSALRAMSDAECKTAIGVAVDHALAEYDAEHRAAPLPPMFRKLERERLLRLLDNWLAVELQREQPFSVVSCEERITVDIDGVRCNLQIDRIDRLEDGRRIVIDYKTGAVNGYKSWADMRITDPQLPIYAAIAQSGAIVDQTIAATGDQRIDPTTAAVSFARVLLADSMFVGIAVEDGLLPRVPGIDNGEARRIFSASEFADWQAVLEHWRASIREIAHEVKVGAAAVIVADEADLRYCDVLPILRLAERRAQWEQGRRSLVAESADE